MRQGKELSRLSPIFKDHRSPVFYLVALVFMLIALIQTFVMQGPVPGMTEARWTGLASFFLFASTAGLYRFTGKLRIASALLLIAAYAGSTYAALKQGGAPAPTLAYAPFLPIVATVLLGRAAGVAAACASIAAIAFCTYAANAGLASPSPHTPQELRILLASTGILLSLGVLIYAFIYENLILKAMKETEQAKRELQEKADALEENREFLNAFLEAAHDSIVAVDPDGRVTVFDRAAREFRRLPGSPEYIDGWADHFHVYSADGKTRLTAQDLPLVRAMRGEKVTNLSVMVSLPGQDPRIMLVNAFPLTNRKSEGIGAISTSRDITLERRQEEKIQTQNREIDKFARVASRDLQAPLNRIIKTSEALANSPEIRASAKNRTDLAAVVVAAKKMGALIKDVLYMSRLPIGEISLQPVAARDCIEAAIDLAGISEADCRLDFRFAGSPEVLADPQGLTHIFRNLIENVWKHAAPDVKPHAEFTCITEDGAAVLGVKDNGPGMTEEQIGGLFTPLERLSIDGDEGSGLGLAICRKSLTRMGGEFWVESEPGKGSHFRMRLPLAREQAAKAS